MGLVSVIVPVYNAEKYLNACVSSVLGQTFSEFELLLIDDGSKDNSGVICDDLENTDSRIKVVHKDNGGVSSARNIGLDTARGEYILFVDSDDYIAPNFLETAVKKCKEDNCVIFAAGMATEVNGEVVKKHQISNPLAKRVGDLSQQEYWELLNNNYISSCCNKLISRVHIGDLRFQEDRKYGEDLRFVFSLLDKGGKIVAVPDVFYNYCRHSDSATRNFDEKTIQDLLDTYFFLNDFTERHDYPKLAELIQWRWVVECRYAQRVVLSSSKPFYVQYRCLRKLRGQKKLREWALRLGDEETRPVMAAPGIFLVKRGLRNLGNRIKSGLKS